MRLREISELVRQLMEEQSEALIGGDAAHALIQDIQDIHTVYRPIATSGRQGGVVPWLSFSFMPFDGLIEPFNVYPGRYTAMLRVQKQPSGLPELVTHVGRAMVDEGGPIVPDLHTSFSHSANVQTVIQKSGKDPVVLKFYHRCNLIEPDRTTLPADFCLPGVAEALPEGYPDDGIPGIVTLKDESMLYLGELAFYNNFRTPDRRKIRNLLLNCVAVSVVTRYVRQAVRKGLEEAAS